MTRAELGDKIVATKPARGVTWAEIADKLGCSKVYATAALLGQMALTKEQAAAAGEIFDVSAEEVTLLSIPPYRGSLGEVVPTDPLIYRFYEVMQVYGTTLKEVIQEEFGDGIMSAIDFELDVERVPDPKGDRVKVTFNGKFLPYKRF